MKYFIWYLQYLKLFIFYFSFTMFDFPTICVVINVGKLILLNYFKNYSLKISSLYAKNLLEAFETSFLQLTVADLQPVSLQTYELFKILFLNLFYVYDFFAGIYVCTPYIPSEIRRRHQILWSWSCRWL